MAQTGDKAAAEALSALLHQDETELESFAARVLGPDSKLDVADVRRARQILAGVHRALATGEPGLLGKLRDAAALLAQETMQQKPILPPHLASMSVDGGTVELSRGAKTAPKSKDVPEAYEPTAKLRWPAPPPPKRVPKRALPTGDEATSLIELPEGRDDDLDDTNELDDVVAKAGALPFKGKSAAPPSALEEMAPVDPLNMTRTVGDGEPSAPALPFRGEGPPSDPGAELTLEQYATMCAEFAVFSDKQQDTLTRYGLDEHGRRALDREWQQRFADDASLQGRWKQLNEQHQAWLKRGTGSQDGSSG